MARRVLSLAPATLVALAFGSTASASIDFTMAYSVVANSADPGLVVQTENNLTGPYSFSLSNVGDMHSVNLFRIWTDETSVNADDTAAKPISVSFDFSEPTSFGGPVAGTTVGATYLAGLFQQGVLDWGAPLVLDFGSGGQLQVELRDQVFNGGFLGLREGKRYGSNVYAKFTLLETPTMENPEPMTIVIWSLLSVVGFVWVRSRRR